MAAVSAVTSRELVPNGAVSAVQLSYTKAGAADTIDASTAANGSFETVYMVLARKESDGADDPADWTGTAIILSAGTSSGTALIIGKKA